MNTITINIAGIGQLINYETILIERLFKELGYNVEINNPHPFIEYDTRLHTISESEDEYIERVKSVRNYDQTKILINVEHYY